MVSILFLIAGFAALIYGANFLVDSASALAKKFSIPNIVIGLTIVAFGTSAPELVVNIFAALSKNSDITLGNITGSNIFNILGILGISAMIYPLSVKSNTTWLEIPLCFLSAIILLVMANNVFISRAGVSVIDRIDGIILLMFFVIFLVYNIQMTKTGDFSEDIIVKNYSVQKSVIFLIFGLGLLLIGGKVIVTSAVKLATLIGISERIIALTIVSIGTSLPELATSAVAAKKRNVDIAIGNIVGSNIFNAFFILGISAVISPVYPLKWSNLDMLVNVFSSILLFIFIFTGKGRRLDRREGAILSIFYMIYIAALIII